MMKTLPVGLLTDQHNNAVIQLPDRQFPGVLIQGDSLAALVAQANTVRRLAGKRSHELNDEIEYLCASLQAIQKGYEEALATHGIELPYQKQDSSL
jgi:hypothetical protein